MKVILSRRTLVGLIPVMAIGGGIGLSGCGSPAPGPGKSSTLTLASENDTTSFDPAALENGHRVSYWTPLYDTLLILKPDATIVPGMAESFAYNDEKTELTLALRDDLRFSDGSPVTSADVVANMEHHKQGTGQNNFMLRGATASAPDAHTVILRVAEPDPAILTYLTMVAGVVAKPEGLGTAKGRDAPITAGPYQLDSSRTARGSHYTYVRNPHYWDAQSFPFDEVIVKPIPEVTARLNALRSGQVLGMAGSPQTTAEAQSAGMTIKSKPGDRVGLHLADRNGTLVPELSDKRVRQAINYAIDSAGLLKAVQLGKGVHSAEMFSVSSVAHRDDLANAYPYNPDKARSLLAEAGYPNGFSVVMPQNETDMTATLVSQQLGDVGINVTYRQETVGNYITEIQSGRYALFSNRVGTGDPWWDVQKHIPTSAPWNVFKVTNPALDAHYAATRGSRTPEAYASALQNMNEWLVGEAWFAPFYQAERLYYTSKTIDFDIHPQNVVPYLRNYRPTSAS
ncbi:ABC transporter substrate-binding protein [Arthrobacter sp. GMC3]|uniref:ABC transporter substrate-binding protein n=1 Tax=Arthrobacter sp. GMC3 TaxID=2058894 RepID=UPI0015E3A9DA|nr:ABC transporter substrate-binding protein [Arthrobacter sp. GMC3]